MAIDYFCYSPLPPNETTKITDSLGNQHGEMFPGKFFICKTLVPHEYEKECLLKDHDFHANSLFLLHYNDTDGEYFHISSEEVFEVVKQAFGPGNILILLELDGETY